MTDGYFVLTSNVGGLFIRRSEQPSLSGCGVGVREQEEAGEVGGEVT